MGLNAGVRGRARVKGRARVRARVSQPCHRPHLVRVRVGARVGVS